MAIVLAVIATVLVMTLLRNLIPASRGLNYQVEHDHGVESPQFARDMGHLLGPPLVGGNRLTTLCNGVEIFPAMLDAIRSAQHTITFESYLLVGRDRRGIADALAERCARRRCACTCCSIGVGANKMDEELLARIVDAGAQVHRYHR